MRRRSAHQQLGLIVTTAVAVAVACPASAEGGGQISSQSSHAKSSSGLRQAGEAGWVVASGDDETDAADTSGEDDATGSETRSVPPDAVDKPWRESWSGAEFAGPVWSLYSGFAVAPFGSIIENGWRLRLVSGYSRYPQVCFVGPGPAQPCAGQGAFADLLVGYQHGIGPLTLKGWFGVTGIGQLETWSANVFHRETAFVTGIGPKAALEAWLNVGDTAWTALDLSASTVFASYGTRLRAGYRIWPQLSLGAEAAWSGKTRPAGQQPQLRYGLLARFEWPGGEIATTGGLAETDGGTATPYATLVLLHRF